MMPGANKVLLMPHFEADSTSLGKTLALDCGANILFFMQFHIVLGMIKSQPSSKAVKKLVS
jgi:hypothetical protein